MEEKVELAKHEIGVLVENILYSRILALNGGVLKDIETKNKMKDEMIDVFVQEYAERFKVLSLEQIKEYVNQSLNKTIEDTKSLKQDDDGR